jgi:hypothetical protein
MMLGRSEAATGQTKPRTAASKNQLGRGNFKAVTKAEPVPHFPHDSAKKEHDFAKPLKEARITLALSR